MKSKLAIVVVGSCLTASAAWAGSQLEDTVSNCTGINCGAMSIRGVHQTNEPFVIQVFSAEGECLRLDVDTQTQDSALIVLSPSVLSAGGNDDRAEDDTRPLFFQDGMPATGWYTVAISYWDWAPTQVKFILKYGRYPAGNPNCAAAATAASVQLERPAGNPAKPSAPAPDSTVQD
jgi:hypothetical protein